MSLRVGWHASFWAKYERGVRKPTIDSLALMRHTLRLYDWEVIALVDAAMEDIEKANAGRDVADEFRAFVRSSYTRPDGAIVPPGVATNDTEAGARYGADH